MDVTAHEHIPATSYELLNEREHLCCPIYEVASACDANATTVPINRLPTEILVHIFYDVKRSSEVDDKCLLLNDMFFPEREVASWFSLLGVCQRWRAIAYDTPLWWPQIINVGKGTKTPLFRFLLQRSVAHADIHVTFTGTNDIGSFLDELEDHLSRLRKLSFQMLPWSKTQAARVRSFLFNQMPILEELEVSFGRLDWEARLVDLPNDDSEKSQADLQDGAMCLRVFLSSPRFPHLNRLRLRNVRLRKPLGLCSSSSLAHLMLHNLRKPTPLSDLLDFLKVCQTLETLVLDRYSYYPDDFSPGHHLPPIQLSPTLRWIDLQNKDAYDIALFLSRVAISTATCVRIVRPAEHDIASAPLSLVDVDLDCEVALWNDTSLRARDSIRGTYGDAMFAINFEREELLLDFTWEFLRVFGECPVTELNVAGGHVTDYATAAQWTQVMSRFALLNAISIECYGNWGESHATACLLHALATTLPGGGVPCPHLQELTFIIPSGDYGGNKAIVQDILTCLAARAAVGQRIHKLRLRAMHRWFIPEILCPHVDVVEIDIGVLEQFRPPLQLMPSWYNTEG
ncbi:hypothetical protein GY45DRAFT_1371268 [Cubamyces sp. BRFM 1775]|nr:hypothetical protein GY45DRAFT_1371268 [Cubamyces sp. BRFM 1775]